MGNSTLNWIEDIPRDWTTRKLRHIASIQFSNVDKHSIEGEVPVRLCNYLDAYNNEFIGPTLDFMDATATMQEIRRFGLQNGDVLVTKDSESWEDIAVPAIVASELPGVLCGYHLAIIRPDPEVIIGRFLFRAFQARGINDQFRVRANGITRFGLGNDGLSSGVFPIPPIKEQERIADFLDSRTAAIDGVIEKKTRLIGLLKEKRLALITHAVTKGLDPSAPMRDTGIPWLGKIPAHWEIKRLKFLGKLKGGAGFPDLEQGLLTEEIPFFKVGDMAQVENPVFLDAWQHSIDRATAKRLGAFIFQRDTIAFAKVGAALLLNRRRIISKPSCIDNNMMGFVPGNCHYKWAYYWLTIIDLGSIFNQGAVPSVNEEQMNNLIAATPQDDEQEAIANYLDRNTTAIDSVISKITEQIEKLREYRQALITAAVTGKIEVRNTI